MHDESRTIRVGRQDGFENQLAGDGGDGVALGGADAPTRGARGECGAGFGDGGAEGAGGVVFEFVALFVVGGDDGLEFGEVDSHGGDASPGELEEPGQFGIHGFMVSENAGASC